jgi:hypothetical protein
MYIRIEIFSLLLYKGKILMKDMQLFDNFEPTISLPFRKSHFNDYILRKRK